MERTQDDVMSASPELCPKCGSAHVDVVSRRSPLGERYPVVACRWCTFEQPVAARTVLSAVARTGTQGTAPSGRV
jgi:hypothetical protein